MKKKIRTGPTFLMDELLGSSRVWSNFCSARRGVRQTQHTCVGTTTAVQSVQYRCSTAPSTMQYSTEYSTAQHSTAQHSTAQHSTAQHSTAQHSTAQHSTAQHSRIPLFGLHWFRSIAEMVSSGRCLMLHMVGWQSSQK